MGLGDFGMKNLDPTDRYFDIINNPARIPRRPWIVKPDRERKRIPGMENWMEMFHSLQPDQWQMLVDFVALLKSDVLFTKKPNWMEPPITAVENELVSETPVVVGATDTDIVTYQVPDRHFAVINAFGNALTDPTQWGTVVWNLKVNTKPVQNWQNFLLQRGMLWNPTTLVFPIVLPPNSFFEVTASTSGGAVSAFARCKSYVYSIRRFTQDGTYRDHQSK
jgi:hypothetical protein